MLGKTKMNPERKGDAFAKLIRWFRKKHWFFLVGAKKITKKQCLFDKNIVLVFLFDGAVRRALPLRKDIDRGVFFFVRKKTASTLWSARKGFRKAVFSYRRTFIR
jgi:hypothetical protein